MLVQPRCDAARGAGSAEHPQGAASDAQELHRMLLLLQKSPEQEAALQQLLGEQQNKTSGRYHEWVTPEQFGTQFGPSDADVQAVTRWLASQGFGNIAVAAGRTTIEFSGTAGQVRNAFHTEIRRYTVKGEMPFGAAGRTGGAALCLASASNVSDSLVIAARAWINSSRSVPRR